jgi:hypothetical protein
VFQARSTNYDLQRRARRRKASAFLGTQDACARHPRNHARSLDRQPADSGAPELTDNPFATQVAIRAAERARPVSRGFDKDRGPCPAGPALPSTCARTRGSGVQKPRPRHEPADGIVAGGGWGEGGGVWFGGGGLWGWFLGGFLFPAGSGDRAGVRLSAGGGGVGFWGGWGGRVVGWWRGRGWWGWGGGGGGCWWEGGVGWGGWGCSGGVGVFGVVVGGGWIGGGLVVWGGGGGGGGVVGGDRQKRRHSSQSARRAAPSRRHHRAPASRGSVVHRAHGRTRRRDRIRTPAHALRRPPPPTGGRPTPRRRRTPPGICRRTSSEYRDTGYRDPARTNWYDPQALRDTST